MPLFTNRYVHPSSFHNVQTSLVTHQSPSTATIDITAARTAPESVFRGLSCGGRSAIPVILFCTNRRGAGLQQLASYVITIIIISPPEPQKSPRLSPDTECSTASMPGSGSCSLRKCLPKQTHKYIFKSIENCLKSTIDVKIFQTDN